MTADCMTARAVVRRTQSAGCIEVEFSDLPRCRGCEGACMWRRLPVATRLRVATELPVRIGDSVLVALPERYVLVGAILLHGLPWAALLAGAVAGFVATGTDTGSVLGALGAVALALLAARRLRGRIERMTMRCLSVRRGA
jgi:positive regulator of sigma E activity